MYVKSEDSYPFIRFPKALIESPFFGSLSAEAKLLFALILDRMNISKMNADRFTDESGSLFVLFTIGEICRKLGCSHGKAVRLIASLELHGLIIKKRCGRGNPTRIIIQPSVIRILNNEHVNSRNENPTAPEIGILRFPKSECNNTDKSNTYIINTQSITGYGRSEDEIKEQIEYDCIACDENRNLIDEIVMIISDVLAGTSPTVRIGKDELPRDIVAARFRKLDSEHINYVLSGIKGNTCRIKNIKAYLTTMLYNAPATMEAEITATFSYYHNA